jgi:tetratricopeptide (TPR) repeat protein
MRLKQASRASLAALRHQPTEAGPAGDADLSALGNRVWLKRLILAVGSPFLFLLFLEVVLRLCGFGNAPSFLLPWQINGREMLVQNDRFTWRFLGSEMARQPFPLAIPQQKPPGTIRIFVMGESAAYGDPQPDFGLPRMLEALLGQRFPSRRFEIVNTAMTAINSHAILPIARECARQNGDIWVIYMGNNEVVGPFGAGTVFGPRVASLGLIRCSLALKATRTGQFLDRLLARLRPQPDSKREWGGMAMFLGNQVRQEDPRMRAVYTHFKRNLDGVLDAAHRGGARVILSTVASNLKDCAPFASLHAPGLSVAALGDFDRLYQQAVDAEQRALPREAIECVSRAARVDSSYAGLHYLWGRCCMALGQDLEALVQFTEARDLDVLRFRADSRINELIRQAAASRAGEGVHLIDAERTLANRASHGIVGEEFFYEHVHLNFEGNYLLAHAIADEVARLLPPLPEDRADPHREWASPAECAQRLAWTDWSAYQGKRAIIGRISDPPFTTQFNQAERYARLRHDIEQLSGASLQAVLQVATQRCEAAIAAAPNDWVLHKELALAQEKIGDFAGAASSWRRIVQWLPHCSEAWQQLGRDLAEEKQDAEAISVLQQALKLDPNSVPALSALAQILAGQRKTSEAVRQYEKVLRLKPYWSPAHLGLGKALEAAGRSGEAERHFREAQQSRLYTPAALSALGRFCFEKGWLNDAVTNFTDALKLDPGDAPAHVNLGVTLITLGRRGEAQSHFAEAVRLDPSLAEAHVRLGFEFGRQGHDAEAMEHFAQAVRLKPDLLEARLNFGIALTRQHREQEALSQFEEVLRQDPTNSLALKYVRQLSGRARGP